MAAAARGTYVDFAPPHSLQEEPDKVVLRVDLSEEGFRKDQLRVKIDNFGRLRISGDRQRRADSGNQWQHFSKDFHVPEGCDAGAIRARLEKGGVLLITMPRLSPAPAPEEETTVADAKNAGSVDAKDQKKEEHTGARQEAAPAAAEEDKENAGDASMERRRDQQDEQQDYDAGGAASAGRPAYGFAQSRRRSTVWAIAALVLALVGAGMYARYKLMDPSAETAPACNQIVALWDN